ncbi:hypothetical protein BJV74DRAFT_885047 [Russula compacta]|nr:hypothetical protein BJV74DRAFT_885047 [Russula compacta]
MSVMKTLVTGFVDRPPNGQDVKRKPTTSLANYDIELLKVWYGVLRDATEGSEPPPQLVVFLHEFEQFDEAVVQDLFHICRQARIHQVTTPLTDALAVYPQSMLSLLRVDSFTVPSGTGFLEEIVTKTFFDLHFEPDIMVGPAALDFLSDFFCRNSTSVEGVLLILQLAHLKHFDEPLTVFVQGEWLDPSYAELAAKKLSDPKAAAFVASLFSWSFGLQELASNEEGWPVNDVPGLLASIVEARANFHSRLCRLKLALGIMRRVQKVMLDLGHQGAGTDKTPLEMMSASLSGGLAREGKYLGTMRVHDARQRVEVTVKLLEDDREGSESAQIADEFGDWLIGYFQERIINLEDLRLWEIWHTGSTPFPSEMINPAPRATIVSALLQPHTFLPLPRDGPTTERLPIWNLPDASILFRRYLEAGQPAESPGTGRWGQSDSHRDEDENEEEWKMHVQARFVRALHTLDFVGFVKHTGRKADHVMRTVYDMPE